MSKPTAQEILEQLAALKPRLTSAARSLIDFNGSENLEQALGIHNSILLLRQDVDRITPQVKNVQQPVSLEDASSGLKLMQEYHNILNSILAVAQEKKTLLDRLPISHLSALAAQDVREVHASVLALGNAVISVSPSQLIDTANTIMKEVDEGFKRVGTLFK
ncbi:hypothetical protein AN958_05304 [Leucoagaricus sp. SymC.cos]|nr:hypothetical protein AN958_05304 [Leucoagaricus sp. SymC.cos]